MEINFSGVIRRAALAAAAVLAVAAGPAAADPLTPDRDVDRRVAEPGARQQHRHVHGRGHRRSARRRRCRPPSGPTGTVTLEVADVADPGLPVALPLVNGAATCQGPAGSSRRLSPRRRRLLRRHGSHCDLQRLRLPAVIAPATVTPSVTPNPVLRLAPITYKATVAGISHGGAIVPAVANFGTMAFFVDGELVAGLRRAAGRPLLKSSCPSLAPPGRRHARAQDGLQRQPLRRSELRHDGLRRARARRDAARDGRLRVGHRRFGRDPHDHADQQRHG